MLQISISQREHLSMRLFWLMRSFIYGLACGETSLMSTAVKRNCEQLPMWMYSIAGWGCEWDMHYMLGVKVISNTISTVCVRNMYCDTCLPCLEVAICQMRMGGKCISEHFWHIAVIWLMKVKFWASEAVWMVCFPTNLERHVAVGFVEIWCELSYNKYALINISLPTGTFKIVYIVNSIM